MSVQALEGILRVTVHRDDGEGLALVLYSEPRRRESVTTIKMGGASGTSKTSFLLERFRKAFAKEKFDCQIGPLHLRSVDVDEVWIAINNNFTSSNNVFKREDLEAALELIEQNR